MQSVKYVNFIVLTKNVNDDTAFGGNIDFVTVVQKRATAKGNMTIYTNHHIKLDMAKEISMQNGG